MKDLVPFMLIVLFSLSDTHTHTHTHTPHTFMHKKKVFHFANIFQCVINNLTTVSPVYSQDFVVHQRSDSLIFLFYSQSDPVVSGVMGLISELKPEQHNLHL